MGEINIPRHEQDALSAVDVDVLDKLIEQAAYEETPRALHTFALRIVGRTLRRGFEHSNRR